MPDRSSGAESDRPWLLVAKGRVLQDQSDFAAAGSLYEEAARLLAAAGDKEGLLPVLLGWRSASSTKGSGRRASRSSGAAARLLDLRAEKAEVLVAEGSVLVSLCRWDEAVEKWEKALILAPAAGRAALTQRVFVGRARLFHSLGHYRLAKSWIDKAMSDGSGPGHLHSSHGPRRRWRIGLSDRRVRSGRAFRYRGARLVLSRRYGFMRVSGLLCQAAVALGRWDYRGAVAKLREAQSLAAEAGDAEQAFRTEEMFGDLCRCNRNPQRALEHHRTPSYRGLEQVGGVRAGSRGCRGGHGSGPPGKRGGGAGLA